MNVASYKLDGSNYTIKSQSMQVSNLKRTYDLIERFVKKRGGQCRFFRARPYESHNLAGFCRGIGFVSELFVDGIIVSLAGSTLRDEEYFVNPSRRSLQETLLSGGSVGLNELDEYADYAQDREFGFVERKPELTHPGNVILTLEGSVKHFPKNLNTGFYDMTGLPRSWPLPLKLIP
jgi:hypothetical protein